MKRFILLPLLFIAFALSAAPINERQAREIATSFFQSSAPTRSATVAIELVFAGDNVDANAKQTASVDASSESLIYIYNRQDVEGFVVVAGDDAMRPIIAFSFSNTFNVENSAAATRHMLSAWCKQVAAARVRQGSTIPLSAAALQSEVGSQICQYETAKWGQDYPYNLLTPVINGQRCVTGCVATAAAIVCRYNLYPARGLGTTERYNYTAGGVDYTMEPKMLGSTYDYANMPLTYTSSATTAQKNAVALLMSEMGAAVKMSYSPDASGTTTENQIFALTNHFGYNKESAFIARPSMYGSTYWDSRGWKVALQENLKEYGPTLFGGVGDQGGHAFVLDGATTGGFFSVNWGWDGYNNGYFALPDIEFYQQQDAVFCLKPDPEGVSKYQAKLSLYFGTANDINLCGIRFLHANIQKGVNYDVICGLVTNLSNADFVGNVVLAHCDKDGNMKRQLTDVSPPPVSIAGGGYYLNKLYNLKITIEDDIEVGDRLRVLYWSDMPANAKWARNTYELTNVIDEIIIRATPEMIAEKLNFVYDKTSKEVTFSSNIPLTMEVTNSAGSVVVAEQDIYFANNRTVDASTFTKGEEYKFRFTCGDEPYVLSMIF